MPLILDTTAGASTTKLQVILAAAKTTNDCPVSCSYVDFTSSTATDTLSPPVTTNGTSAVDVLAAPGSGHSYRIATISLFNADTAAITATFRINVSAALTTFITVTLQSGDNFFYEDGAGWQVLDANGQLRSAGLQAGRLIKKTILASGTTFTIQAATNALYIRMFGGGGGGGGTTQTAANAAVGAGGAAGGLLEVYIINPQASTITYAIGGTGSAGSTAAGTGGTGGTTSITINLILYSALGGLGGVGMVFGTTGLTVAGGAGQIPTSGDLNARGNSGQPGVRLSGTVAVSGAGASSLYGGGGVGLTTEAAGNDGTGYGSGGGGACCLGASPRAGGVGQGGMIEIDEYA